MSQSLDDIIRELDAGYAPSRQLINQRIDALPGQADAEIKGLTATKDQAFNDITAGARARGLGFSGIPLGEQAQYTASSFLPAVARVRQSQNEARTSLLDALNQINLDQRKTALGVRETQLNRDFERQQAEQQRRAAASNANPTLTGNEPRAVMQQRNGGGFNFADISGQSISAAKYAQLTGQSMGQVLYSMGQSGDKYAQQLYNQLKADPFFGRGDAKYDARIKQAYAPIFWGV